MQTLSKHGNQSPENANLRQRALEYIAIKSQFEKFK